MLALACSSADPPPTPSKPAPALAIVTSFSLVDATPVGLKPAPKWSTALEKTLTDALAAAGVPRGEPKDGAWRIGLRVRVGYGVTRGEGLLAEAAPGHTKAVWSMEARLRPPGASEAFHAWFEGRDQAPFDGDAAKLAAELDARLAAGAAQLARGLGARVRLLGADVPELVKRLGEADPLVRRAAAGRLGMLKATGAVPSLAARMKVEDDRETLLRMVGVLSEIGNDQAASALIDLADTKDRELFRAVVNALSVVGGERVDDFFEMLSVHDAADVRLVVEQASARLKRKK